MRFGLRELIFVLLLLASPVGAYFLVFQPRSAQIANAQQEIAAKRAKLAKLEAATRSISDLGNEIDRLAEALHVFEQRLPKQQEVEKVLKEVWQIASKHDLKPESVKTDKIVDEGQFSTLPLKMQFVGDFDGFYSFLLEVEKLPRISRIPQMDLSRSRQADEQGLMKANVTLQIFFEGREASERRPS